MSPRIQESSINSKIFITMRVGYERNSRAVLENVLLTFIHIFSRGKEISKI